jgi:(1->4)-alpha-D-glucan 1-alpha-D-glucosylmutase
VEEEANLLPRIPVSTYRVQLNRNFGFADAREIVHYLHDLGISDIYASPYFATKKGSLHGYDIVNPNMLNPEVGTEEEYNAFVDELQKYGMGQILDIVPNHMCIESGDNLWWMDVLENGPSSLYADYFDIEWEPVKAELKDKVLLPILGAQYGNVLEKGEIKLVFENGAFFIYYYDNKFPVIPKTYLNILRHRLDDLESALPPDNPGLVELLSVITALTHLPPYTETDPEKVDERYREKEIIKKRLSDLYGKSPEIKSFLDENLRLFNGTAENPSSFDLLDELLRMQAYRLSYWRVATEEINYRRFFDINGLAALRVENPMVFKAAHQLTIKLIGEGKVTGLRVDHPDGLYNPAEYFRTLQRHCFLHTRLNYSQQLREEVNLPPEKEELEARVLQQYREMLYADPQFKPFYVVGEKILIKDERMPDDWNIFSTTGYVFLNTLNGIFVKAENVKAFDSIYSRFIRTRLYFQDILYENKKLIMQVAMASEVNMLGHYLDRLSEKNRHTRDFTLNSLTSAILEVIAFFPVYRTYISESGVNDRDRRYIELAVSKAKKKNPAISGSIFDFLKDVLLLNFPGDFTEAEQRAGLDFVMRFQQITGPVMAKGVEDTVFYVYNRLISLNEVGGSPERFGTNLDTFHGKNIERMKYWPHALITTSTHDTKRSEDVRARINVLSEIPGEWRRSLISWARFNRKKKPVVEGMRVPERNEEYLLYQTLTGAWPVNISDKTEYEAFRKRIKDYMLKAVREAKVNTSWINPDTIYEDALMVFIDAIMNDNPNNLFLKDFRPFREKVSGYGMFNSLSQTLLKIASPGVPDFYQGSETWNYRLVDPDNREPVDYSLRMEMLEELKRRESGTPLHELARDLTINRGNGQIKLYLTYKALNYRSINRDLFERGEYMPLEVMGEKRDNVCAFVRRTGNAKAVVVVPRFFTQLVPGPGDLPLGEAVWKDSFVVIPTDEPGAGYRNIFTAESLTARYHNDANALLLSEVLGNFPVAMLERLY